MKTLICLAGFACMLLTTDLLGQNLCLVIYKQEKVLEVWNSSLKTGNEYRLLKSYPILAIRPQFGPKRREGDGMTPEGLYRISLFNPNSAFHKSMKIDYPNRYDRANGERGNLGGDIFIHGKNVTAGCIAIGDSAIDELYAICRKQGTGIPVMIFPSSNWKKYLELMDSQKGRADDLSDFFKSMLFMFDHWTLNRKVPHAGTEPGGWAGD
jgi:murein L,D-transpeptidase YafK